MLLDNVKQQLLQKRGKIRCEEIGDLLESLGFEVRDGKRGGHKIFVHPGLIDFHSGSYNCGHGKNPEIKQAYINNILRILDIFDTELRKCLGGSDDE